MTEKIRECYRLLELEPGAPLNEVKQAYRERIKIWDRDRFPDDARFQEKAAEKSRELNEAFGTVTAYLAGKYSESKSGPRATPEETGLGKEISTKQGAPAETQVAPKVTPSVASKSSPGALIEEKRPRVWSILLGIGLTMVITLLGGLVMQLLEPKVPALTPAITGAHWLRANERTKRAYARAILVEMNNNGMLQKYRVGINEDFFYEGLESLSRQPKPEDLSSTLVDLGTRLMAEKLPGGKKASE